MNLQYRINTHSTQNEYNIKISGRMYVRVWTRLNRNAEINTVIIQLIRRISIHHCLFPRYNVINSHILSHILYTVTFRRFIPWENVAHDQSYCAIHLELTVRADFKLKSNQFIFTNHKNAMKIAENWIWFYSFSFCVCVGHRKKCVHRQFIIHFYLGHLLTFFAFSLWIYQRRE